MRLPSIASFLGIGAVFAPPALSQSIVPFQGDKHSADWPGGAATQGSFTRGEVGHFTPGPIADVLQLDGAQPVLLIDPDLCFAPVPLPATGNDATAVRGAHPAGHDAVALVGAAGLELWWWDAALGSFASQSLDSTNWAGARVVRSADLDADGAADLYGVMSDGSTVRTMLASSSGGFVPGASFSSFFPIQHLDHVQWDADSDLELALGTDFGVYVRDQDGTLKNYFWALLPGGALCTIRQDGQSQDRLAWITRYNANDDQMLMTLSPLGSADPVDLGNLQAFAMVATDYDLDGDDDVLISHRYSYALLRIENQRSPSNPGGPTFIEDPSEMETFYADSPGSAPENDAWPAIGDLDGDGDDDVTFANEKTQKFLVFRGEANDQDDFRAGVTPVDYVVTAPGDHGHLNVTLAQPASIPASATHLDVVVWRQASPTSDIDDTAVGRQEVALPATWPLSLGVKIPEGDCAFYAAYHVQIRLVEKDAGGAVQEAWPTATSTFSLVDADVDTYAADEGIGVPSDVPAPTPEDNTWGAGLGGRRRTNTHATGSVPTFPSI